jgi:hypothetical protein
MNICTKLNICASNSASSQSPKTFKTAMHLLPLHEEIMRIRHDFMAHRNDNEFEQAIVYLVPNVTKNTTDYKIRSLTLSSANIETLKNYIELFQHVENVAYQKMQKQIDNFDKKINSVTKSEFDQLFIYPKN